MEPRTIRGSTKGALAFSCFMCIIIISFSVYSLYIFTVEPTPTGVRIFISVLIALFLLIPGVSCLVGSIFSYLKKIQLFEEKLVLFCPFKKKKEISVDDLTLWGCVAYAPKSTMLFFCTASQSVVLNYLYSHWNLCERIFGKNRVTQLKSSSDGMIQLAAGTYLYKCLFYPKRDVFILKYGTPQRLRILVNALKQDALITGPWLIDTISSWEEFAKYRPKI